MKQKTFLVEIRIEYIPANILKKISLSFYNKFIKILNIKNINYKKINWFATHKKIAIQIINVKNNNKKKIIIKKGPPTSISYDKFGNLQKPAILWMKKLKIDINKIKKYKKNNSEWLIYKKKKKIKKLKETLPKITKKVIYKLSHPHFMRWNKKNYKFIRPVRNIIMLLNKKIIPFKIFNLQTNNNSQGLELNKKNTIKILHAKNYESILLKKGNIIVNYKKRKKKILKDIRNLTKNSNSYIKINKNLLNEVNSLVEQPTALISNFNKKYLSIPKEIIIYVIEKILKSFPLFKKNGDLKSYFIFIINLQTKNYKNIILGYKSVISSKLQDIIFFLKKDIKTPLKKNKKLLKNVLFYNNLGSLYKKQKRLQKIILFFSKIINFNIKNAFRAASLSKYDIVSNMVSEFPDMQGIVGSYYAKYNNEKKEIYKAIKEQYLPKYENDKLPQTKIGKILSISDKFDNLIGLFLIGKQPKSDKDPFALRRTVIGILKIIITNKISFNLNILIEKIVKIYNIKKPKLFYKNILNFIINRFNNFYKNEKNIKKIIKSVTNFNKINLFKINKKIKTLINFIKSINSKKILILNKRIDNILKKNHKNYITKINKSLLSNNLEKKIVYKIKKISKKIKKYNKQKKYKNSIQEIINIHSIIEKFFNEIKINHEIKEIKINRLSILKKLKNIFSKIANFSYLY
ncbi:Glycine--tRNA ligase beta subunit [Buchnera aphidicola (Periphyllus testudinaceus)]|uniref:glycine--tRNA ligase subunit beta n=1 Tax=Buchnera aphidicola TaxID=9 RepID=UPI0034648200